MAVLFRQTIFLNQILSSDLTILNHIMFYTIDKSYMLFPELPIHINAIIFFSILKLDLY